MRLRGFAIVMFCVLAGAACSSSTSTDSAPTDSGAVDSAPAASDGAEGSSSDSASSATSDSIAAEPLLIGAEPVTLLTPTEGGGPRPLMEWESVEGASEYLVVVLDGDGAPYWAWSGSATSVRLGGGELPDDHGSGPIVESGALWSVSAYDSEGNLLAISGQRSIAP